MEIVIIGNLIKPKQRGMDYGMGYGIFNRLCYETIYLLAYICSALYWPAVMHLPQSFEGQRSLKIFTSEDASICTCW